MDSVAPVKPTIQSEEEVLQSLAVLKRELEQVEKDARHLRVQAHQLLDKEKTKNILEKIINDL